MQRALTCAGFVVVILTGFAATAPGVDLAVNEFMTTNDATIMDEYGDFEDWVEIHNFGSTPVNIEGMFLTDNLFFPTRFELPDTIIPSGGFIVVWCDDEENEGVLHANFKLDGDGEAIGLFETLFNGNDPIDTLSFGQQIPDVSLGRYPDATGEFALMGAPSAGAENNEPYNLPPYLTDTEHAPINPSQSDTVTVTTEIVEDIGLLGARIFYRMGGGFLNRFLYDDGMHGDGAAGDGLYGGAIPPQLNGTLVEYYVWAQDDSGLVGTDPPNAPSELYAYEVGYEAPHLFINEFLASNNSVNPDEWGDYDDWVEIFNGSDEDINMGGLHLTDNLDNPDKFVFPDTLLPSGGFLLVWCDGEEHEGPLHTDFKLSASGEQVGLYDSVVHGLEVIDSLSYGVQTTDISYGRVGDGAPLWQEFAEPTPGASNGVSGVPGWSPALVFRSLGNAPNPVAGGTRIRFQLPEPRRVVLRIISADGREVARLLDGLLDAGRHAVAWDARDGAGRRVSTGVYFYDLHAGRDQAAGKMLIVD
ncbi:MAG: hypothetical protein GF355_16305 [Candidatus Eisenbacteria bacterium]|nr:hypothetical protein [Candidatus Eisenbacteria bacterium]